MSKKKRAGAKVVEWQNSGDKEAPPNRKELSGGLWLTPIEHRKTDNSRDW